MKAPIFVFVVMMMERKTNLLFMLRNMWTNYHNGTKWHTQFQMLTTFSENPLIHSLLLWKIVDVKQINFSV